MLISVAWDCEWEDEPDIDGADGDGVFTIPDMDHDDIRPYLINTYNCGVKSFVLYVACDCGLYWTKEMWANAEVDCGCERESE